MVAPGDPAAGAATPATSWKLARMYSVHMVQSTSSTAFHAGVSRKGVPPKAGGNFVVDAAISWPRRSAFLSRRPSALSSSRTRSRRRRSSRTMRLADLIRLASSRGVTVGPATSSTPAE